MLQFVFSQFLAVRPVEWVQHNFTRSNRRPGCLWDTAYDAAFDASYLKAINANPPHIYDTYVKSSISCVANRVEWARNVFAVIASTIIDRKKAWVCITSPHLSNNIIIVKTFRPSFCSWRSYTYGIVNNGESVWWVDVALKRHPRAWEPYSVEKPCLYLVKWFVDEWLIMQMAMHVAMIIPRSGHWWRWILYWMFWNGVYGLNAKYLKLKHKLRTSPAVNLF